MCVIIFCLLLGLAVTAWKRKEMNCEWKTYVDLRTSEYGHRLQPMGPILQVCIGGMTGCGIGKSAINEMILSAFPMT
jgi:hypothetical protein